VNPRLSIGQACALRQVAVTALASKRESGRPRQPCRASGSALSEEWQQARTGVARLSNTQTRPGQRVGFFVQLLVRGLLRVRRLVIMVMSAQFRCASECCGRRS
jgi:hypothetical protein